MRGRPAVWTGDAGLHLIEVSVAAGLMAVAVLGLAGAMSLGMSAAGQAKQRSVAGALASERLEWVRELPFAHVALSEQPVRSTDPADPDSAVSTDGSSYSVGPGTSEPLVVDTVSGAVRHVEDPYTSGHTRTAIHQFVTWVDDASIAGTRDYKRVTVVVDIADPMSRAASSRLVQSTFVGRGGVLVPQSTPAPATPGPASSPSASAPPPASCDGDTSPPTGSIALMSGAGADAGYTNAGAVQVELQASDGCPSVRGRLSNDGINYSDAADLTPDSPSTVSWTIPPGDGSRTIWARFVDGAGNASPVYHAMVTVDRTPPTVPASLTEHACGIGGTTRTVTLTWTGSSDTNLAGYRLYRSINNAPFAGIGTTSTMSATDASPKGESSVRYLVRSYDRAGNESPDSTVITYAKNSC